MTTDETPHREASSIETSDRKPNSFKTMLSFSERIDVLIRVVLAVAVSIGCYFIIEPFLTAIVIAAILAVVTWPLYACPRLDGRQHHVPGYLDGLSHHRWRFDSDKLLTCGHRSTNS